MIVIALAAAAIAYMLFKHRERQRRLELVHQERLAAMDKGFPLLELPIDLPRRPPDPRAPLVHGIVWSAFGVGGMLALRLVGLPGGPPLWPLPLPLALLGAGLILYYVLVSRAR